ncbi:MAG: DUF2341 domain-containing protein [Sphingomonadaceae bacterium]|nr:DUF2341 domain-containing protein [Sphingomonadaceae bacterium]
MIRWLGALIALVMLAWSAPHGAAAQAADKTPWWSQGADWKYRRPVTIDTTAQGQNLVGAVGRAPVLVRLAGNNFDFAQASPKGLDLRFLDGGNVLAYHIESWDPQTGIANVWVDVPGLAGGTRKTIYMYYGKKDAPSVINAPGTFDADYQFVTHFHGQQGPPLDATGNQNGVDGAPAAYVPAGAIGRAARFQGTPVTVKAAPALDIAANGAFSASSFVREDAAEPDAVLVQHGAFTLGLAGGVPYATLGATRVQAGAPVPAGQYAHLAATSNGGTLELYVNGEKAGEAAGATPPLAGPVTIGRLTGLVDEVRLSKVARPANLFAIEAAAGNPQAKLLSVGEAQEPGASGGVLGYVLGHVGTLDWLIIGLCMALLALAIGVMIWKNTYISDAKRANAAFMRRYLRMHGDLESLEKQDVPVGEMALLKRSPLARIYQAGLEALDDRRAVFGNVPLSAESTESIRAELDARMTTENQKLDAAMVLLTIAISGGPFIGLLGTVIGVMTVFGGVAMAGDVNVNAIAPGIAAALMATIAGLSAAIPALFGYNYLTSRITQLSDEMRVFVDRLTTRLAETQLHKASPPPPARLAAE